MATGGRPNTGAITLEQLIALNDEMAALVRAGVPLERGLAALGGELPGRPGKLAERLASRMDAGENLSQILADEDERFPPVWRAVVEAGLRSGHLAAALESLSATARRAAELRKPVGAGMLSLPAHCRDDCLRAVRAPGDAPGSPDVAEPGFAGSPTTGRPVRRGTADAGGLVLSSCCARTRAMPTFGLWFPSWSLGTRENPSSDPSCGESPGDPD